MLLFGYALSWIFAFIGLSSSSPEAAQALGFIGMFPLTFASSAFVPVESMPSGLEAFAEVNPFTTTVDAMRALFLGAPAGNDVWGAVAWSLGLIVVFAALSVARYRRAVTPLSGAWYRPRRSLPADSPEAECRIRIPRTFRRPWGAARPPALPERSS